MQDIWEPLTQDSVLNTVEAIINEKLSNLFLQRNSYINRVYELKKASGERIIAKFYRPGRWTKKLIQVEHDFLKKLSSIELNVIVPSTYGGQSVFEYEDIYLAIFPYKGGRALDEFDKDSWQEVGRLLGRMHNIGSTFHNSERIKWEPKIATQKSVDYLINNNHLPADYVQSFQNILNVFFQRTTNTFNNESLFLIHGDCHKGNLIHRPGEGTFIIDFDDICIGPAVQDIWMLLPDEPEKSEQEISWFLSGYEVFRPFNRNSFDLVPVLKIMRMIHFAAWCAMQKHDKYFEDHFPDWGTTRYWNSLIKDIQSLAYNIQI